MTWDIEGLSELRFINSDRGYSDSLFYPTPGELRNACVRHGLDFGKTLSVLESRPQWDQHVFIDVVVFRTYLAHLDRVENREAGIPEKEQQS